MASLTTQLYRNKKAAINKIYKKLKLISSAKQLEQKKLSLETRHPNVINRFNYYNIFN